MHLVLLVVLIIFFCCLVTQRELKGKEVRLTDLEFRMVEAVNAYRKEHKLYPLAPDPILMKVARQRVKKAKISIGHKIGGKWPWEAAGRAGFRGFATENLAFGYLTPEDVVDGWADPNGVGHDVQMRGYFKTSMSGQPYRWINRNYNRIGVAHKNKRWIALFGVKYEVKESRTKEEKVLGWKPARMTPSVLGD